MFIVIDISDPYFPCIVTDIDDGTPLIFDTEKKAQKEADQCQKAIVVEI